MNAFVQHRCMSTVDSTTRTETAPVARAATVGCRPSPSGYTLIEMLMVIAVLGLAGSLLIPYMVDRETMVIQAATRHLISDMTYAQSDALAHQSIRRVHFYEDGRGYCLIEVDPANFSAEFDPATAVYLDDPSGASGTYDNYIVDYTEKDGYEGITIDSVNIDSGNSYVSYDELGGTVRNGNQPGTGGEITISNDEGDSYKITIAPFTGKLSVQEIE